MADVPGGTCSFLSRDRGSWRGRGNGELGRKGRGNCKQDAIYERIKRRKEMNFLRDQTQTLVYFM